MVKTEFKKKIGKVCSMDWHPPDHCSFLSNNIKRAPMAKLLEECELENGAMQVMWPDHCVQGSDGAKLHDALVKKSTDKIVMKGVFVYFFFLYLFLRGSH